MLTQDFILNSDNKNCLTIIPNTLYLSQGMDLHNTWSPSKAEPYRHTGPLKLSKRDSEGKRGFRLHMKCNRGLPNPASHSAQLSLSLGGKQGSALLSDPPPLLQHAPHGTERLWALCVLTPLLNPHLSSLQSPNTSPHLVSQLQWGRWHGISGFLVPAEAPTSLEWGQQSSRPGQTRGCTAILTVCSSSLPPALISLS